MVDEVLFFLAKAADDLLEPAAARDVVHVGGHRLPDGDAGTWGRSGDETKKKKKKTDKKGHVKKSILLLFCCCNKI